MIPYYLLFFLLLAQACGDLGVERKTSESRQQSLAEKAEHQHLSYSYLVGLFSKPAASFLQAKTEKKQTPMVYYEQLLYLGSVTEAARSGATSGASPPVRSTARLQTQNLASLQVFKIDFRSAAHAAAQKSLWQKQQRLAFWELNQAHSLSLEGPTHYAASPWQDARLFSFAAPAPFFQLAHFYSEEGQPWWFAALHALEAFTLLGEEKPSELRFASNAPVIAILDSGLDYLHPALEDKLWRHPRPGETGCADDTFGCDVTRAGRASAGVWGAGPALPYLTSAAGQACPLSSEFGRLWPSGACVHGTHIAGLIAGDIAEGVPGLCPTCKIWPIKVVEEIAGQGRVLDSAIFAALKYIQKINALYGPTIRVVNMSFGKFDQSLALSLLLKELRKQGVLVVAAAGNENTSLPVFPAALPEALAVTGLGRSGAKASYANFGSWVQIAAPGGEVHEGRAGSLYSAVPGGGGGYSQGTSVASPLVAAVAGLLFWQDPKLQGEEVKRRILDSADRNLYGSDFAKGYNRHYEVPLVGGREKVGLLGRGVIDAQAALSRAPALTQGEEHPRVRPGCGVINPETTGTRFHTQTDTHAWVVFLLLLPLVSVRFRLAKEFHERRCLIAPFFHVCKIARAFKSLCRRATL